MSTQQRMEARIRALRLSTTGETPDVRALQLRQLHRLDKKLAQFQDELNPRGLALLRHCINTRRVDVSEYPSGQ